MVKKGICIFGLLGLPILLLSLPLKAEENVKEETAAARRLSINRSLLIKAEDEKNAVEQEEALHPSENLERKLRDLQYKIKALKEDAAKIQAELPKKRQAVELLRDLILQRLILQRSNEAKKPPAAAAKPNREMATRDEKVAQLHAQALKLVSEKRLKEAAELYEDIILADPDNDEAYLLMAHTYLLTGDYVKAEMAFHSAVQIDPENINEIIPFYRNIIIQNPDDDTAYSNLGFAYLIVGDFSKAEEAFKDSLGINPENNEAQKGMGIIARRAA